MDNINDAFVQASRAKLRFQLTNGLVATEDLWSASLSELDKLAIALRRKLTADNESFITTTKPTNQFDALQFDIVRYVIDVRLKERDRSRADAVRAQQRQKLLEARAAQQDAAIRSLTPAEIDAELKRLDAEAST